MAETVRVVITMSPDEKRALEAKAKAAQVSVTEMVRLALDAFGDEAAREAAELRRLLDALGIVHSETLRRLDMTERKLDDTLSHLRGKPH